jgi:hypothetical protein
MNLPVFADHVSLVGIPKVNISIILIAFIDHLTTTIFRASVAPSTLNRTKYVPAASA